MTSAQRALSLQRNELPDLKHAWSVFKKLEHEKVNMYGGHRERIYRNASHTQATEEAEALNFKGWLKDLFVMERTSGYLPASNEVQPDSSFIEAFSGGILKGGTKTPPSYNPQTNRVTEGQYKEGSAEGAEKVVEKPLDWIEKLLSGQGLRLLEILGGALLVLFGLYVLVKGDTPSIGKVVKHAF